MSISFTRNFELWATAASLAAISLGAAVIAPADSARGRAVVIVALAVCALQGSVVWAVRRWRQNRREAALKRAQALLHQLVATAGRTQPAGAEFSRLITAVSDELQQISSGRSSAAPQDYPGSETAD